jgi:hypothetical protein
LWITSCEERIHFPDDRIVRRKVTIRYLIRDELLGLSSATVGIALAPGSDIAATRPSARYWVPSCFCRVPLVTRDVEGIARLAPLVAVGLDPLLRETTARPRGS